MPNRTIEAQLRQRGLQVLGPCEHLSQRTELRAESALLRDFTPEETELLGAHMLRIGAQPGQLLIAEGDASDWMMILLRGTVDIGKRKVGAQADSQEPGDTTRLGVVRAGAVLGEMSMLDGEPRYASCWALSEVEAAVMTRAAVGRLIGAHPAVGAKLLVKLTQLLAQRLRNTSNTLVKVLRKNAAA
ncbi:Crp/Fnr family transcriptional regulator [Ramlibacter sp.]|uniref:Crp/Fnr family transcriptional regulator n=1 Tax=Ramlibacter sp. TaxID=1917967 RepID=UPI002CFCC773|nr:Crp/Fnr family transcriptional regulator [Ramlibacter sp.]HWI83743.1 Crp/Fnr family transcriptional regulator [Ramlibacter sp.]